MKKLYPYFMSGIIPIAMISISPFIWKSGYAKTPENYPIIFLVGMIVVITSWAIAAHHIHLGYIILNNLSGVMKSNKSRVRLVSIMIPGISGVSDDVTLFYFERKRNMIFYEKWSPIKNHEFFPDLQNSNSVAYFLSRESAIEKLQMIKKTEWKRNPHFDQILIESEYIG